PRVDVQFLVTRRGGCMHCGLTFESRSRIFPGLHVRAEAPHITRGRAQEAGLRLIDCWMVATLLMAIAACRVGESQGPGSDTDADVATASDSEGEDPALDPIPSYDVDGSDSGIGPLELASMHIDDVAMLDCAILDGV